MNEHSIKTVISDSTETFRFTPNSIYTHDSIRVWCDITINVKHIKYEDDLEYYYLEYTNIFSNKKIVNGQIDNSHPFFGNSDFEEHLTGDIILKNEMTEKMIKYLLMPYDSLDKFTSSSNPQRYKANIMRSLTFFWD